MLGFKDCNCLYLTYVKPRTSIVNHKYIHVPGRIAALLRETGPAGKVVQSVSFMKIDVGAIILFKHCKILPVRFLVGRMNKTVNDV